MGVGVRWSRRTDPKALKAEIITEGEGNTHGKREDIVRNEVEESAEVLATLG